MRRIISSFVPAAAALVGAMFAQPAEAALEVYEPFNYSTGNNVFVDGTAVTGTGLTGTWSVKDPADAASPAGQRPNIVSGLTYAGLPTQDNALQRPANSPVRALANLSNGLSSGTKWVSFLFQDGGNSGAVPIGLVLNSSTANSLFVGFRDGFSGTDTFFGMGLTPSGTAQQGGPVSPLGTQTPISNTAIHFIAIKIDFTGGNESLSLYINPTPGETEPALPTATDSSTNFGTFTAVGYNGAGGPLDIIDEIRIGDSFAEVSGLVPEPASASLLIGAGMLMARRRRSK